MDSLAAEAKKHSVDHHERKKSVAIDDIPRHPLFGPHFDGNLANSDDDTIRVWFWVDVHNAILIISHLKLPIQIPHHDPQLVEPVVGGHTRPPMPIYRESSVAQLNHDESCGHIICN